MHNKWARLVDCEVIKRIQLVIIRFAHHLIFPSFSIHIQILFIRKPPVKANKISITIKMNSLSFHSRHLLELNICDSNRMWWNTYKKWIKITFLTKYTCESENEKPQQFCWIPSDCVVSQNTDKEHFCGHMQNF